MDDEIQSLTRKDTWEIVSSKLVADHNVLPGTRPLKCKRKPDRTIREFKARCCVRGDIYNIISTELLNSYSPVVQLYTVRLMLIFQCIIGVQSQIIDFKNAFTQADITSGEPVLIELPRDLNSDGEQCDAVIRLKKSLYVQAEATRLWYENLRNGLLEHGYLVSKVDLCMLMSDSLICVVYVDDFLFCAHSQYYINTVMKYFKEDDFSYN